MRSPKVDVSAKMSCASGFAILRAGDHAQQIAGPALLHDDGLQRHVERAELHQAFDGIGQNLRIQVVDVGFDNGDGQWLIGASPFRRAITRSTLACSANSWLPAP